MSVCAGPPTSVALLCFCSLRAPPSGLCPHVGEDQISLADVTCGSATFGASSGEILEAVTLQGAGNFALPAQESKETALLVSGAKVACEMQGVAR